MMQELKETLDKRGIRAKMDQQEREKVARESPEEKVALKQREATRIGKEGAKIRPFQGGARRRSRDNRKRTRRSRKQKARRGRHQSR